MPQSKVRVAQGVLAGIESVTRDGKKYISFLGIPYAQPPVGDLRFKDPLPAEGWRGERDASLEGSVAVQINMETNECIGDEDCLYLNIHTPYIAQNEPNHLPVMIFIHGGAFNYGSGNKDEFGPEYIVEKDCILVSFNYRLGVLGFLCLDSILAPGNMGLKDQTLAIKWVRDNIASFNGDSKNITLFGISAGACSIEAHLLSPCSKGLFQKTIIQSGSVLNPFVLARDHLDNPIRLAQKLGKNLKDPKHLYDFFKCTSAKELIKESTNIVTDKHVQCAKYCGFTPVVSSIPFHENFLDALPIEKFKEGNFMNVPTISGFCNKEGILMKTFYKNEPKSFLDDQNFIKCLPHEFKLDRTVLDGKLKQIYKPRYTDINKDDYSLDYLTDLAIHGGLCKSTELKTRNSNPVYFYCFTYDGNMNYLKSKSGFKEKGACHADEQTYLGTNQSVTDNHALPMDTLVRKRMVQMWTDFSKTGDPTPQMTEEVNIKWLPISGKEFRLLNIGEELSMKDNQAFLERRSLWNEIYDSYE